MSPESMLTTRPTFAAAPRRRLKVELEVRDDSTALVRVLMLLQRRQCHFEAVDFIAADAHGAGRFRVAFTAPVTRSHCAAHWLEKLIEVVSVELVDA